MLMLAPCTHDASFGRRYPTYWGIGAAANSEAGGIANFIAQAGYPRVFTIAGRGTAYGSLLERYFVHAAPLSRLRVVGRAGISDADAQAAALARAVTAARATALFTSMSPPQVGRLVMQLRRHDVNLPIFGTTAMDTTRTLRGGVRSLQESFVASYGFARETKGGRRFRDGYRLRFGHAAVGSYPGLGYETIRVLEGAVRRARSAKPSAIQQALAGGLTIRGIALPDRSYVRGGSHNPVTSIGISKILGRRLRPVFAGVPTGRIPPP
jgi:ABC-type branched-subunit amino acid transport system substrate-binding protein